MDEFVSIKANLAKLDPKEYCILLGYYSFCRYGGHGTLELLANHVIDNPEFLERFNAQGVSYTLNYFSKHSIDLNYLFAIIAEHILVNPTLQQQVIVKA